MIPERFLTVSQRLGSLLHEARSYKLMPRSVATEEYRQQLWDRYGSAKAMFVTEFPQGAKLPNWEVEDLKETCTDLLISIRDIIGPKRPGAAPPSSGSAPTPRPRPPSSGAPTTQRSRAIGSIPAGSRLPRRALAEALEELDHSDVPPKMRAVRITGSKGRYGYAATAPTEAGRYSQATPDRTPATAAKGTMRPKAPDWAPEKPLAPDPVIIMPVTRKPELMLREPRSMRINDGPTELLQTLQRLDGLRKIAKRDGGSTEAEGETGWDIAIRGSRQHAGANPAHASAARRRIRAAVAPAFAGALDKAVDAKLLTQFAARHPGGVAAAQLRTAYAERATRNFAGEFVKLVGGQPPASAQDIAMGAIIAVAIAQTTATFPIVPPAAVAPMAVVVHRSLRPRLAELARMAAVIAAAPTAPAAAKPAARNGAAHEMTW